jgi:hypothetical protein
VKGEAETIMWKKMAELCWSCPLAMRKCPANFNKHPCKKVHKVKVDGVIRGMYAPPEVFEEAITSLRADGYVVEIVERP